MKFGETGYIQNAHRLPGKIAKSVKEIRAGQHFHKNDDGEFEYADGTRPAYPTMNDRYQGSGYGDQGELVEGRDNVSRTGQITVLMGNFEVPTDQYDKDASYEYGQALTVKSPGILIPAGEGINPTLICGVVTQVPEDDDDYLRYSRS